ncbi:MAG: acidobacterial duplicated orphan permease [Candidatus Accumulibacter appositus]|uniref:Acidobacterial duplicated orphan permease n=1 Tax=Candidatus Accumulibacter appositus TaxID=1454003 RepID=A0A011NK42_9PROT|nr:FtsX-like permease family protein [Accumulibacter sp.]EXI83148.1 MAG: acidobacterial duplicated orphan permease [Candidatus Accumulibacter appositus]HRF04509.1 ABC transporter permease [Accumulibacter sp.]
MNLGSLLSFSWRMLRRDARGGELRLLAAALVVAVAALTAVGFFTDRVRQALERESHQLLGADLLLVADHPWPASFADEARARGLAVVETRTFPSMVSRSDGADMRSQLAEVKAVSAGYPLRGSLRVAPALNVPDAAADGVPARGEIWIDERLASALAARVGDRIVVGQSLLRVAAVLTLEPDRGINFFSVAPRLLMTLEDLPATGLLQIGSRVGYRLLLAGDAELVKRYQRDIETRLARGQRIEDPQNGRPEIRTALDRAQKFLGLSALLTVVLAAVAVALAARRYVQRHLDPCAVMRCLGATQALLLRLYLGQFAVLGLLAAGLGCGIGYLAHFALHAWLAQLLATPLPPPGTLPLLQGVAVGLLLLFGFAVPPLLQLKKVSTLRVLRGELGSPQAGLLGGYLLGFVALAGLMFWVAGEVALGAYVVGAFTAAVLVFSLIARLAIRLAAAARGAAGSAGGIGWRYGLASLERRASASVVQIVALALGFMALMLLTVTRGDLLDAWQRAIPPDAPNRFVVNIQPEQVAPVRALLAARGLSPELAPMVRGRLTAINGARVSAADYSDDRAQRLIEREFNLSMRADLPAGNSLSAGRWFSAADLGAWGEAVASVEGGLARTLDLSVGDRVDFEVAGETVGVRVVGLRKVDWDTMRVNFFVLTPPAVLQGYPASWITSFHLPAEKTDLVNQLLAEFPNLTVIDVAAILRQLKSIMDQVAQAVQFIFLFTLAAGFIVLYAALASAAQERRYELAVMRALGARREQLRRALLAEFAAIGALSGLIASLGAIAIGQFLAREAFQFEVAINFWLPLAALFCGAALVTGAGWFAASRLLQTAPLETLRAGSA